MTDIVEPTAAEPSTAAAGVPAETSPETSNTAPENNDGAFVSLREYYSG